MTKVNLDITTWHNNDGDEDDDGPWRWQGTTSGTVDRVYISYDDHSYGYRGIETDLEPPFFVVYAEYEDGGTFGIDYDAEIVGVVKTEEEARALKKEAEEFKGYGQLSNGHYVSWNGYFAHLHSVSIERIA